jgi:organic hydroperoxide reductase OsmC/OhrA
VSTDASHDGAFQITLTLRDDYRMTADFGLPGVPPLQFDEPVPLGAGEGPNAARALAAAVGNCLAASLLFCLRKSRVDVKALHATVTGTMSRNQRGRLRIAELQARLEPVVPVDQHGRMQRCLEVFEDYCLVSQSVRQGIAVASTVEPVAAEAVPAAVS